MATERSQSMNDAADIQVGFCLNICITLQPMTYFSPDHFTARSGWRSSSDWFGCWLESAGIEPTPPNSIAALAKIKS
jgi:hypothetical protein